MTQVHIAPFNITHYSRPPEHLPCLISPIPPPRPSPPPQHPCNSTILTPLPANPHPFHLESIPPETSEHPNVSPQPKKKKDTIRTPPPYPKRVPFYSKREARFNYPQNSHLCSALSRTGSFLSERPRRSADVCVLFVLLALRWGDGRFCGYVHTRGWIIEGGGWDGCFCK